MEIFFIPLTDDNVSVAILHTGGKFSILVNSNKHKNRQHFTLAHELGHYFLRKELLVEERGFIDKERFLDGNKVLYRMDDAERDKVEIEANRFAASLIMPKILVNDAMPYLLLNYNSGFERLLQPIA